MWNSWVLCVTLSVNCLLNRSLSWLRDALSFTLLVLGRPVLGEWHIKGERGSDWQIHVSIIFWPRRSPLYPIWSTFSRQSLSRSQLENDRCQHNEECVPAQSDCKTSPDHHTGQTPTWMWNKRIVRGSVPEHEDRKQIDVYLRKLFNVKFLNLWKPHEPSDWIDWLEWIKPFNTTYIHMIEGKI